MVTKRFWTGSSGTLGLATKPDSTKALGKCEVDVEPPGCPQCTIGITPPQWSVVLNGFSDGGSCPACTNLNGTHVLDRVIEGNQPVNFCTWRKELDICGVTFRIQMTPGQVDARWVIVVSNSQDGNTAGFDTGPLVPGFDCCNQQNLVLGGSGFPTLGPCSYDQTSGGTLSAICPPAAEAAAFDAPGAPDDDQDILGGCGGCGG